LANAAATDAASAVGAVGSESISIVFLPSPCRP
jgi:hypothetical protein